MPKRGRYTSARKSMGRGRPTKRARVIKSRVYKRSVKKTPIPLKKHTFCERVIAVDALRPNGAGLFKTFKFADIYNSVSYQKLFEYYTLNKVVVKFRYKSDGQPRRDLASATAVPVNEANPVLWFKVDHNDNTADTLDVMKSSTRTKEYQITNDKPHFTITLKPAILNEAYKSTVASTYVPKWSQMLSTGDPTVPHYGLKVYATGPGAPATDNYGTFEVTYKYYFTCKNNE